MAFDRAGAEGDTIIAKDVSGSGVEEVLLMVAGGEERGGGTSTPQRLYPLVWIPDGKYLIYLTSRGEIDALELIGELDELTEEIDSTARNVRTVVTKTHSNARDDTGETWIIPRSTGSLKKCRF